MDAIINHKFDLLLQNSVTIASRILTSDAAVDLNCNRLSERPGGSVMWIPNNFFIVIHISAHYLSVLHKTTVLVAFTRFSISSFTKALLSVRTSGHGSIASLIFGLSGANPITTGFCMPRQAITQSKVALVAVAVNAITLILVHG